MHPFTYRPQANRTPLVFGVDAPGIEPADPHNRDAPVNKQPSRLTATTPPHHNDNDEHHEDTEHKNRTPVPTEIGTP